MTCSRILFRVDASMEIGTGHLVRCLTLATALHERGEVCVFLCRPHSGNLIDIVNAHGHQVIELAPLQRVTGSAAGGSMASPNAGLLGTDWHSDASECLRAVEHHFKGYTFDWLVVDHYALGAQWERMLRPVCRKLMVIDDLADRAHDCDLLLDQNLGSELRNYADLIPPDAVKLLGPRYALLRPQFARLRQQSLARRITPCLKRILVTMGGVDQANATSRVLDALDRVSLPDGIEIVVVMGVRAPWTDQIRKQVGQMRRPVEVLVAAENMARIMAESDLAIGAGGATTWERCSLGLPSIQIPLAANQCVLTEAMASIGAAMTSDLASLDATLEGLLGTVEMLDRLAGMSEAAAKVTEGRGSELVVAEMES